MKGAAVLPDWRERYLSSDWYALRAEVLAAAGWRCKDCGHRAHTAHHLTYRYGIICDPRFLVAVCWPCHRKRHGRGRAQGRKEA